MKSIATVQSIHNAEVAALMLHAALSIIGCPIESGNDLVIVCDELRKEATLECRCNELLAWFKKGGQNKLRTQLGRMASERSIAGYLTHPILTEEVENYKELVSICISFRVG